MILRFLFSLYFVCGVTNAAETADIIRSMSSDLSNRDYALKAANALVDDKGTKVATKELFRELVTSNSMKSEAAAVGILLQIDPYPFLILDQIHQSSKKSVERAYSLHLMNLGAQSEAEIAKVVERAKESISDNGSGIRRYGEAAAYSPNGKRPSDIAYNILVVRKNLKSSFPIVNVDNFSLSQRNVLIQKLASQIGVNLMQEPKNSKSSEKAPPSKVLNNDPIEGPNQKIVSDREPINLKVSKSEPSLDNPFPYWIFIIGGVVVVGLVVVLKRK